jgi:hypothetical protein
MAISDEKLFSMIATSATRNGSQNTYEALLELRERRAAGAADKERVRAVVDAAVFEQLCMHDNQSIQETDWTEMRLAIADRAAEQLSGVPGGLSEPDRRALTDLRLREQRSLEAIGHLGADVSDGIKATIATLDRLLGAAK